MGKVAFLFSGQGDQFPGMGWELYENHESAARVFRLCESIRPGTIAQCFQGTAEELQETKNTQPCLFAMELAAAEVLKERGVHPDVVAGFSLGEIVAATTAGCFEPETGFRLVCRRGELMQAAAQQQDTAMAAVVKLTAEQVISICENHPGIYPVNFNCPGNITVSGLKSRMPAFCAEVKAAGGRALPLKVRGAFHSPFMQPAADAFSAALERAAIRAPQITLYSNVTALPYEDNAAALLAKQIASPVLWERTIRNMIHSGVDTFIEIGPGRTLTNMVKKIDPTVTARTVSEILEEWSC